MADFTNKIVLITGGTKGIGLNITKKFIEKNANVFVIYSKDDEAKNQLLNSLNNEQKNRIFIKKGSVNDSNFLKEIFKEIKQKFSKLDILINNAGINKDGFFVYMPKSDWQNVFKTNIIGTYLTSFLAKDLMKKSSQNDKSFMLNISSISGLYGRAGQINYATSKGAIFGITRLFAKKYAQFNINVNTLIPGLIDTDMAQNIPEQAIQEITNATFLKRIGSPNEIAEVVLFLCSQKASYITGTSINVDGGFIK